MLAFLMSSVLEAARLGEASWKEQAFLSESTIKNKEFGNQGELPPGFHYFYKIFHERRNRGSPPYFNYNGQTQETYTVLGMCSCQSFVEACTFMFELNVPGTGMGRRKMLSVMFGGSTVQIR